MKTKRSILATAAIFNGRNGRGPLVRNLSGIRLSGINGATAFRIGMLNLTAP